MHKAIKNFFKDLRERKNTEVQGKFKATCSALLSQSLPFQSCYPVKKHITQGSEPNKLFLFWYTFPFFRV